MGRTPPYIWGEIHVKPLGSYGFLQIFPDTFGCVRQTAKWYLLLWGGMAWHWSLQMLSYRLTIRSGCALKGEVSQQPHGWKGESPPRITVCTFSSISKTQSVS